MLGQQISPAGSIFTVRSHLPRCFLPFTLERLNLFFKRAVPGTKGWAGRSAVYGRVKFQERGCNSTCSEGSRENFPRNSTFAFSPRPNTAMASHIGFLLCQEPRIQIAFLPKALEGLLHQVSSCATPPPFSTLPSFSVTFQGKTHILMHVSFFFKPFFSSSSWKVFSPSRPQSIKFSGLWSYYSLGWPNFLKIYQSFCFFPHLFSLKPGTDVRLECQFWSFLFIFL